MDEIVKMIVAVSPYAAVALILGKAALEVLHDYLRVAAWKQDRILARLRVIEQKLEIPADPADMQPPPDTNLYPN